MLKSLLTSLIFLTFSNVFGQQYVFDIADKTCQCMELKLFNVTDSITYKILLDDCFRKNTQSYRENILRDFNVNIDTWNFTAHVIDSNYLALTYFWNTIHRSCPFSFIMGNQIVENEIEKEKNKVSWQDSCSKSIDLITNRQYKEAHQLINKSIKNGYRSHIIYLAESILYGLEKNFNEAIISCRNAILITPSYYYSHYYLGQLYIQSGREFNDKAISAFNKTIECNSNYGPAYIAKSKILVDQKKFHLALENIEAAISIQPERALWHNLKAYCLNNIDRTHEAFIECNEAIRLDSTDYSFYIMMGEIYRKAKYNDMACACYKKAYENGIDFGRQCMVYYCK